jgi:hypothetical protein
MPKQRKSVLFFYFLMLLGVAVCLFPQFLSPFYLGTKKWTQNALLGKGGEILLVHRVTTLNTHRVSIFKILPYTGLRLEFLAVAAAAAATAIGIL